MRSRVVKSADFRWPDVPLRPYKDDGALHRGVTRQTLAGSAAAATPATPADDDALAFETRYFEIAPGGFSSFERHLHSHVVVVLRGRGTVRLGNGRHEIAPFDCVVVAPREPHQFRADRGETLGFLCVVDRERDRPEPLTPEVEEEDP